MSVNRSVVLNQINQCEPLITAWRLKNGHFYVFRFRLSDSIEALRAVGYLAADPASDFSWYDVALVSKQIRDLCGG